MQTVLIFVRFALYTMTEEKILAAGGGGGNLVAILHAEIDAWDKSLYY